MKVILKDDVKGLGIMGSVVNVANGYGRNYLIPRNLAIEANPKNIRQLEHEKNIILARSKKIIRSAEDLAKKISGITLSIEAQSGEEDKLFGSVTSMDIAEALIAQGVEVDKRKIVLEEPIKRLGTYTVTVKLHHDVSANVTVEVKKAASAEEA
ncbi:MAG: 50S ribosomal protein L9 [Nitrospiraceae bacterium]|nr:MAG: 50S ribosomal protein L9 [Nitrospiraceae bacterium]